ncbi:MAG: class I SAM-dependent methyltransferase [Planctomycetota bacterium]|jgi:SAM-dependent methyltransferase
MPEASYDAPLTSCALCGSARLSEYDRDLRGNHIHRCSDCRVLFMNPQYSDEHLEQFYTNYAFNEGQVRPRTPEHLPDARDRGKERSFKLLAKHSGLGRLLTIGSGDGLELEVARDLGFRVEGYDVDPEVTARVAEKLQVPVYCGKFTGVPLGDASFDAIYMDQVLEHVKNPAEYLQTCHRLLRSGGVLYLGQPNIGSISNRAKTLIGRLGLKGKRRGKHYASRHHLFYYTPGVLTRALRKLYGFDIITVRGSLKPQVKRLTPLLSRWFPSLDSSFLLLARKRASAASIWVEPKRIPRMQSAEAAS